jgi:cellulose synthase/poly-beta-1,6-N-acetylglucosamine synthase-like glycosyltransferase
VANVLPRIYGKIAGFVNIALHIVLFASLLLNNSKMQDVALAYMISVFLYVLVSLIFYKMRRREDDL